MRSSHRVQGETAHAGCRNRTKWVARIKGRLDRARARSRAKGGGTMGAVNARVGVHAARFHQRKRLWSVGALAVVAAAAAAAIPMATAVGQSGAEYQQTNLISDIAGVARITDPNLVNPW